MENAKNRSELYKKLNKIQASIGLVEPDGWNKFDGYKYITSNQLNKLLSKLLPENNIFITKKLLGFETSDIGKSKSGSVVFRTTVKILFDVIDCETGYSEQFEWTGSDNDSKGKDLAQAITECVKRFHFKLFNVSEGLPDPDSKSIETEENKGYSKNLQELCLQFKVTKETLEEISNKVDKDEIKISQVIKLYDYLSKNNHPINYSDTLQIWEKCGWDRIKVNEYIENMNKEQAK